ncbi:carbonic anhydrase 14 isoform X1 [Pogoniulus pusillus]|uniref:carbonic anhydrase 14 isoform X1 n=1 Tax=Pogoniulus pusillus TaxID=488313 RepID=UPI0030B921EB
MLRALLLLGGLAPALPAGPHWAYEGPHGQQHWPEAHPACGGQAQSPIDIRTRGAQADPSLPPVRPVGYQRPDAAGFTLANNGHTVVLALPPSLQLEGLPHAFAAAQLHFHWGQPGHSGGAEHLLDGHRAPAEMHVVHYDAEHYSDASEAQHHAGGLAVLGVLLEVGSDPHPAYDNILRHLGSITYAGQSTSIPSFSIQDLLPPRLDLYYRYNGSLTTPPCLQSVLWTVFQQPVRISLAQSLRGTQQGKSLPSPSALWPPASSSPLLSTSWPRGCGEGAPTRGRDPGPTRISSHLSPPPSTCSGLGHLHLSPPPPRARVRTQQQEVVFKASTRARGAPRP